jgi:hypothetical protein
VFLCATNKLVFFNLRTPFVGLITLPFSVLFSYRCWHDEHLDIAVSGMSRTQMQILDASAELQHDLSVNIQKLCSDSADSF